MGDKTLVLGIGNLIRGDDAIGIRLVRRLKEILPPQFTIKELTTAGLDLLAQLSGFGRAILIDAIQTARGIPGEVHCLSLDELKSSANLASTHSLTISEVIRLGEMMIGKMPRVEVLAIEAVKLDEFSHDLSPQLAEQFDHIVETVREKIEREV